MTSAFRLRFRSWLAGLAALLAAFVLAVLPGLRVETDLLDLLPRDRADSELADRLTEFAGITARKLVFLVGHESPEKASEAAQAFAVELGRSGAFVNVRAQWGGEAEAAAASYRENRFVRLPGWARELLRAQRPQDLERAALASLYSPLAFARPAAEFDPLGFEAGVLLEQMPAAGAAQLEGEQLVVRRDDAAFVMVLAETRGSVFGLEVQRAARDGIAAAGRRAQAAAGTPVEVLVTGALPFAAAATDRARREVALFSSIGTIVVLALLLTLFRSWRAPVLGLVALSAGACAGITATHLVFGQLHLIALVFGSSLIGVAIDYSMHFLSDQFRDDDWSPQSALRHVAPPILMGMAATLIGFAGLLLLPFPGLQQMAVIAITGLPVACGTVLCLYPVLVSPRAARLPRWCARLLDWLAAHTANAGRSRWVLLGGLPLLALLASGVARVDFQDDVRTLQPPAAGAADAERRVRALLQDSTETALFVVTAPDAQTLLQSEERLTQALDREIAAGRLGSYRALTQSLPSVARQRGDYELLRRHVYAADGVLPRVMRQVGFDEPAIAAELARFPAQPRFLEPQAWLERPASALWRPLWLGERGGVFASIVSFGGARDLASLSRVAAGVPGVRFVDRVQDISRTLAQYRRAVILLLAAAYVALAVILALAFGVRTCALMLIAPVGASLLALGGLGWLGIPLTLFTALSLLLMLAMGVDYAIFLREARAQRRTALLAVTLSALTTLFSFGLLAFSTTPFIRAIGVTLALGIGACWLLAVTTDRLGAREGGTPASATTTQ